MKITGILTEPERFHATLRQLADVPDDVVATTAGQSDFDDIAVHIRSPGKRGKVIRRTVAFLIASSPVSTAHNKDGFRSSG